MNLTTIKLDYTAKASLIEMAKAANVNYVCIDVHKRKPCAIFSQGNYKTGFKEFILFIEDLTLDNLKTMIEYGVSR